MAIALPLYPAHTTLLGLDCQTGVVLFGIATSGVVLSTLLEACDADYRTAVIADCCAHTDADLHRLLMERLFPLRGEVTTAAEFISAVKA